jgi:hypothetical protein
VEGAAPLVIHATMVPSMINRVALFDQNKMNQNRTTQKHQLRCARSNEATFKKIGQEMVMFHHDQSRGCRHGRP